MQELSTGKIFKNIKNVKSFSIREEYAIIKPNVDMSLHSNGAKGNRFASICE